MQKLLIFTLVIGASFVHGEDLSHSEEAWDACYETLVPYILMISRTEFYCKSEPTDTKQCIIDELDIGSGSGSDVDIGKLNGVILSTSKKTAATEYVERAMDDGHCEAYSDDFTLFEHIGCLAVKCALFGTKDDLKLR